MKTIFDHTCLFDIFCGVLFGNRKGQRHFTGELINILSAEGIANRYVYSRTFGVCKRVAVKVR